MARSNPARWRITLTVIRLSRFFVRPEKPVSSSRPMICHGLGRDAVKAGRCAADAACAGASRPRLDGVEHEAILAWIGGDRRSAPSLDSVARGFRRAVHDPVGKPNTAPHPTLRLLPQPEFLPARTRGR